jgi:hypothetical protein
VAEQARVELARGEDMATEAQVTKATRGLTFFERYLSIWVILCIVAGIILGKSEGVIQ